MCSWSSRALKMVRFGHYIVANQIPGWEEYAPLGSLIVQFNHFSACCFSRDDWKSVILLEELLMVFFQEFMNLLTRIWRRLSHMATHELYYYSSSLRWSLSLQENCYCRYYIGYKALKKKIRLYGNRASVATQDECREIMKSFSDLLDSQVCSATHFLLRWKMTALGGPYKLQ